jgi:hypothetical protein
MEKAIDSRHSFNIEEPEFIALYISWMTRHDEKQCEAEEPRREKTDFLEEMSRRRSQLIDQSLQLRVSASSGDADISLGADVESSVRVSANRCIVHPMVQRGDLEAKDVKVLVTTNADSTIQGVAFLTAATLSSDQINCLEEGLVGKMTNIEPKGTAFTIEISVGVRSP